MSRHTAREKALKFLYQLEVRPGGREDQLEGFLRIEPINDRTDRAYFDRLIQGVENCRDAIDSIIAAYLRGWTMDRQLLIDLSILRIAVFELLFDTEIPAEIAISEAVIFANEYGTDQSRSFINAVLGSIEKKEKRPGQTSEITEDCP
ncbi:MAG TPA: transcription antitermination factor NusB [Bacillota bacterium]|jgi:N utilization substance protein B|nr:transcription antitermination factor NusB [Fastidiosipila sp.]HPX92948.1 transcription antitermination factor NusB [Bacillota bacterium]HQB80762.1 transcription antitermination factor NusB [Bacillota bacterium]